MTATVDRRRASSPERLGADDTWRVPAGTVIAVSGHAGSRKSDLATLIAQRHINSQIVRFGEVMRRRAEEAGLPQNDTDVLQRIGAEWVAQDTDGLCRYLLSLSTPTDLLVVDGVRHEPIRAALNGLIAPTPITLVMLKSPRAAIVAQLKASGKSEEAAEKVLANSTETDIDGPLLANADLVLDGTDDLPTNADKVIEMVNAQNARPDNANIVGGLDRDQRVSLTQEIAHDFGGWSLRAEVCANLGITEGDLDQLIKNRDILTLDMGGTALIPGLSLSANRPNPVVATTLKAFTGVFTNWETLAWLLSGNGWLNDARPIDMPTNKAVADAIRAELSGD